MIEILQTEESTHSTMQQIQGYEKKSTGSIYYQAYDSRSKKSKNPSNEQNSSSSSTGSTGSKKKCFRCGEPFSRQHMKECRAQDVICNGCGIKGHLKKCCKKSGNFPKDSNRQNNQSSPSTGPGKMNVASAVPQADFFDEKGLLKEYNPQQYQHTGSMYVLKKFQGNPSDDILFADNGVEIQHNTSTSVSDPDPAPILPPDFPFQEFPLTEVVSQSQIDSYSISDTLVSRECSNSTEKAPPSTDFSLKSVQNCSSDEEMAFSRDLTVSTAHTQSSRDFSTISISDNSATRKSITGINPGITTGITTDTPSTPTTFPEETDVTAIHAETPEELQIHSSNYRFVILTDTQALTALQNLLSDDFETHSTQRKGEETPDTRSTKRNEAFQLIQKIHNQLQTVQWDLQRLQSMHKYDF